MTNDATRAERVCPRCNGKREIELYLSDGSATARSISPCPECCTELAESSPPAEPPVAELPSGPRGWRMIDSAPKDTDVLIFCIDRPGYPAEIKLSRRVKSGGFEFWLGGCDDEYITHWHPLPSPPSADAEREAVAKAMQTYRRGRALVEENARLTTQLATLTAKLAEAEAENAKLREALEGLREFKELYTNHPGEGQITLFAGGHKGICRYLKACVDADAALAERTVQ